LETLRVIGVLSHRGGRRVAVIVRPVDRALAVLRLGLIPVAVFAASVPTLGATVGLTGPLKGWPLALTGITVVLVYILLLQTEPVGGRVDLLFARLRRRVTIACHPEALSSHEGARAACWLTPQALRGPLFDYEAQSDAVRTLTGACRQQEPGQYWFLEGRSGSGKTRTALLFVQALVRDLGLLEFGNRSCIYDFGESDSVQDALLESLGTSRHDRAVVLVDNFHLVRPDVLRGLTTRLIRGSSPLSERLLLFLARPADAWNLSPRSEVLLVSAAKTAHRHLKLTAPPAESIARSLSEFDPVASQLVWDLQDNPVASAPQLYLAQVIARNRPTPGEVSTILGLLEGEAVDATALHLVRALAVVSALSMQSGEFSRRAFRRAVRIVEDGGSPRSAIARGGGMTATLRRLRRIGVISRSLSRPSRYVFHEAIAKLCIDRLSTLPAFEIPFTVVGQQRLGELLSGGSSVTAWLIAVEVGAQQAAQASFDAAMANGPYTRMLRCLLRARARYELSAPLRLQLAILLDRTGDFAASRREFTDDLMRTLSPASELSAMFAASRLEASHDERSAAGLELLLSNPERLVVIVGEYWELHIAAHHGSFASRKLLELATEALGLLGSRPSHWLNYSIGRMHFDSLRHHYLEGGLPVGLLASPERRALAAHLRTQLASYEAFEILYTKAHLVGHVLLPQLGLYLEPVTAEQTALAGIRQRDTATLDDLVSAAQGLYRYAQAQFSQYGDREATYLQADVLNADMIETGCNLDGLEVRLREYQRFIADTGFRDIASYPHLYYLRWHMLQYYRTLAYAATPAPESADEHLAAAWRHLRQIIELDTEVGNEYGLTRAKLLRVLLGWVREQPATRELTSLAAQMRERGYMREATLLEYLAGRQPLPIAELHRVLRFYPFVGQ
jgi:hypothetical protein